MSATPIYDAAWLDVTIAALFADLKADLGMTEPAPKARQRKVRRPSAVRLAILNESPILYALGANA